MHKYDVAIVLGGGIDAIGQLSPEVPPRVKRGLSHYWAGHVGHVVLSGGWSHRIDFVPPRTEAEAMFECALELGAPPEALSLEERSTGTLSQAYEAKISFMLPNEWDSALIVAARRHSYQRLEFIFQRVWGPSYDISIDTAMPRLPRDVQRREQRSLFFTQLLLRGIPNGDHESVARVIRTHDRLISRRSPSWKPPFSVR